MFFGTLLFIALIAAAIWLLLRAFRSQTQPTTGAYWQQQNPPSYWQNAPPPVPGRGTYEEGGRAYRYPE
jgi:hypothetical protein